jgi:hypothetical protein
MRLRIRIDVLMLIIGIVLILAVLLSCSHPLRLDPQRQELQRKQDQCLARGGNPQECRP